MAHFKHILKDLKKIGAVAPSSKFLVKDLSERLRDDLSNNSCRALKILELGAGTGPLTKQIVKSMRPQDQLDVVEINQYFSKLISKRFAGSNVRVHHADILHFEPDKQYDYIFSSLPYENMPEEITAKIWNKKLQLCQENAYICYFKYVSFRKFKSDFEEQIVERYKRDKKLVFLNLPPAKLFTLEIDDSWKNLSFTDEQVA